MKVSGNVSLIPPNSSVTLTPLVLDDSFVAPEVALASALATGLVAETDIAWNIGLVHGMMQWGSVTMPEFPARVIPANIDTGSEGGVPIIWHKCLIVIDARTGIYVFAFHGDPEPSLTPPQPSSDAIVRTDVLHDGTDTCHIVIYRLQMSYLWYRANRGFRPDGRAETYECLVNGTWPDQYGHRRYPSYDAAHEAAIEAIRSGRIPRHPSE